MRFENLVGNGVQKGQNSVRFCLTVWDMACMHLHEMSNLFSGRNKNILKCRLLKFLPRVLSVNNIVTAQTDSNEKWHVNKLLYILWLQKAWERKSNTVDSRYLELQGTLWNTSRYPYFDISDLRNRGKQLIKQPPLTEWICNLTLKLEIYWKYCGKEEKLLLRSNFSSFPQYFVVCW